jgi:hypothetical protein
MSFSIPPHYHCELCGHVINKYKTVDGVKTLNPINLVKSRLGIALGPDGTPGVCQIPAPVCNDCVAELKKQESQKIVLPDGTKPRMN